MFTGISWTDYVAAVVILLVVYYAYVGVRYFSGDLRALLTGKKKLHFRRVPQGDDEEEDTSYITETTSTPISPSTFEESSDSDFEEVEHLIGRLKEVIADASGRELIPQEFSHYLRITLKEYPNIKNSPLRPSVNELIVSECEKYGTVTLSVEEVDRLWNGSL
mgnify:CR=1 FL=1